MENILDKKSEFDLTQKSVFSNDTDMFTTLSYIAFLSRNDIPYYQKTLADNYLFIKKIYKFQAVLSKITKEEENLLKKYNLMPLEYTTIKQAGEQIALLQQMALDETLAKDAEKLFEIRVKELKFISASCYSTIPDEIHKGYIAFEHYLTEISRYSL